MRLHRWMPALSLLVLALAALSTKAPTRPVARPGAVATAHALETRCAATIDVAPERRDAAQGPDVQTPAETRRPEDRLTAVDRLLVGAPLDRIDEATEDLIAMLEDPWASEDLLSLADRIASVTETSRKQALARLLLAAASLSEEDDATQQFLHLRIARLLDQESNVEVLATLIRMFVGTPTTVATQPGLVRALCRVLAESSGEARDEAASALGVAAAAGDRESLGALLAAVADPSAPAFAAATAALANASLGDGMDADSRDRALAALSRVGVSPSDPTKDEAVHESSLGKERELPQ